MIATFTKQLRFARALKSRPYAMVWIGQSLSGLGDAIFYIALAWQVLLMTHSGTAMGLVLAFTSRFFGEGGEIAQNGEKSGEADVADRLEQTTELVSQENNVCLTISHYPNG